MPKKAATASIRDRVEAPQKQQKFLIGGFHPAAGDGLRVEGFHPAEPCHRRERVEGGVEAGWKRSPGPLLPSPPWRAIAPREGGRGCGPVAKGPVEGFEIELPWPSRTGNRAVRHGGGSHYLSQEAQAYRDQVRRRLETLRLADLRLPGPYVLEFVLEPPDARDRDFDNLMKVAVDACVRAGLLADDSNQVIRKGTWEWTAPAKPGRILLIGKGV